VKTAPVRTPASKLIISGASVTAAAVPSATAPSVDERRPREIRVDVVDSAAWARSSPERRLATIEFAALVYSTLL
jgi:hypothetical protein